MDEGRVVNVVCFGLSKAFASSFPVSLWQTEAGWAGYVDTEVDKKQCSQFPTLLSAYLAATSSVSL